MKSCFLLFLLIFISKTGITQVAVITAKKENACHFKFAAHDSLIGKTRRLHVVIFTGDIKERTANNIKKELNISREQRLLITRERFDSLVAGVCEIDKRHLKKIAITPYAETGTISVEFYYEKINPVKKEKE